MHYIIYRTTNVVNNKIYIGAHKTDDVFDGYMGSGKILNSAIKKYGRKNFVVDVLHDFDTSADMYAKESKLVNAEFVSDSNTYNLKVGGTGGWEYVNRNQLNLRTGAKLTADQCQQISDRKKGIKHSEETKKKISKNNGMKRREVAHQHSINMRGKSHTAATRRKISEAIKQLPKKIIKCPHCAKEGGANIMKRWHFNNCKFKRV